MQLNLKRPLIFFDLETTGTNVTKDRIVEISIIKVMPDGSEQIKTKRFNPGCPIPAEATAVHHITDEDVASEYPFKSYAKSLCEFIGDADIAGFNSNKFDLPLLIEEFSRAGIPFSVAGRKLIDVQLLYHKMEPRTLVAAYKYYCGKNLEDAHSAAADTIATLEVFKAQIERYESVENDIDSISKFLGSDRMVDLSGRIILDDQGDEILNFGQHKGEKIQDLVRKDPGFINWMLNSDFPKETKDRLLGLRAKYAQKK